MTATGPERIGARIERLQGMQAHRPEPVELDAYREPDWVIEARQEAHAEAWANGIPSRLHWARIEDFAGPVATQLAEWAAAPRGRNLIICGPLGVGKTHAAVAACRPASDGGLSTVFLPAVELFELLRPDGPPGYLWDLMAVDRLIIDDLGAQRNTDWTIDRLYALVNRRWLEERPTVVTTNMDPRLSGNLRDEIRQDTHSRLVGSGAEVIFIDGDDRRTTPSGGRP